ncbi:2-oxo acid dehydrogenase subunit E2, partial [Crocinitomicaceae bacterium]|nr:2-oxo acid dehydrogenase subunit E2 [Crocinitomicaceae bacterium]
MAQIEIKLPKMGESVTEATITNWLKSVGDKVNLDEPLVEVATDKVDNELPSEVEGVLIKQLFDKDQVAQVGDVIAIISTDGDGGSVAEDPKSEVTTNETSNQIKEIAEKAEQLIEPVSISKNSSTGKFYSPLVRSIAEKENISSSELDSIKGTGQDGRVTKNDILAYIPNRGSLSPKAAEVTIQKTTEATPKVESTSSKLGGNVVAGIKEPVININPGDEIMEMDRMRKLISDHMVMSVHVSAHVTSYVEADVTNIVNWRNRVKKDFMKREGENITFTPIFMEAIAKAIKDFPMINVSV